MIVISCRESLIGGLWPQSTGRRIKLLVYFLILMMPLTNCDKTRGAAVGVMSEKINRQHNVSRLLDRLLDNYNHHLRPDVGDVPTVVDVDIMIRSMGPISESDMTYSMDCYFRQTWADRRLAHKYDASSTDPSAGELSLSVSMLNRIWKPDTYFYNGKNSYLHTITTPNKLVRLFPDGRILYSSRLTIKASCPMELRNFPMDVQKCPLNLGSFAYSQSEVVYRWNKARQIVIASGMKMSQFDLVSTPFHNYTLQASSGNYSMLSVQFSLHRHMGSFLIQVYGPCILLVVLSWVSFWLNREATADRVSLGVTTVLTMTFLGLEARAALPKVSYPTALDHFIFISFVFIFATIVQFAFVHTYTKFGFGEIYFNNNETNEEHPKAPPSSPAVPPNKQVERKEERQLVFSIDSNHLLNQAVNETAVVVVQPTPAETPVKRLGKKSSSHPPNWGVRQMNSVSKIDKVSRVFFPLLFITINFIYWFYYIPPHLPTSSSMQH